MAIKVHELPVELYPKQKEFMHTLLTNDYTFYGGSAGGGKSYALMIMAGMMMNELPPGIIIRAIRETRKASYENLAKKFLEIYPKEIKGIKLYEYNKSEYTVTWHNGSQLIFDYCETMQDALEKVGIEQDILLIDEAPKIYADALKFLTGRTRSNKINPKIALTGNWQGPSLKYLRETFYEKTNKGENIYLKREESKLVPKKIRELEEEYKTANKVRKIEIEDRIKELENNRYYETRYAFIPATLLDNKSLMGSGYERELMALPEHLKKIYLEGDPYVTVAQFFSTYLPQFHMKDFKKEGIFIKPHWKKFAVMDYGLNDATCIHWWAIDEDGKRYIYREYYNTGEEIIDGKKVKKSRTIQSIAKDFNNLSAGENLEFIALPHDLYRKQQNEIRDSRGEQIAETSAELFEQVSNAPTMRVPSGPGARKEGWRRCFDLLYRGPVDELNEGDLKLIISSNCKYLDEQLRYTEADINDPEEIKKHIEDHAIDTFRMGALMSELGDFTKPNEKVEEFKEGTAAYVRNKIYEKLVQEQKAQEEGHYDEADFW